MTLSLEKLQAVKTIVTHDRCADGVMSSIILKDVLPEAEVKFLQYGVEQEELEAAPNMLFCDFSPHPKRVTDFVAAGALVLDHHKTARDVVSAFGADGVFGDEVADP